MIMQRLGVPIINVGVYIVVAPTIREGWKKFGKDFGPVDKDCENNAAYCLSSESKSRFALVFKKKDLCLTYVIHEVWHLTNHILRHLQEERINCEWAAHLHSYLLEEALRVVYPKLRIK